MSYLPPPLGTDAPDQLARVLCLYRTLVDVLARPASIQALLDHALQTVVDHLGATGGATVIVDPHASSPAMHSSCGALAGFDHGGWFARACGPGRCERERAALAALAGEWGAAAAASAGAALLGATSWVSHRGEYGLACIVGAADIPTGGWRGEALAAAAGLVGHAIERMRLGEDLRSRLVERDERWASLYEISVALTREMDSDRLLDELVQRAIHVLHAHGGNLSVADAATGESLVTVAYVNGAPAPTMAGYRLPPGVGLAAQVLRSGRTLHLPDYQLAEHLRAGQPRCMTVIAAPLFVQNAPVGVLTVGDDAAARQFTQDDIQTLELLAQAAGAVLEKAYGRQQEQSLAVHRERARLARELHDGLAQNLASLLLKAELCHVLAQEPAPELVCELDELAAGLQRAIRETRTAIFALRDGAAGRERLVDGLRLLAVRFEEQTGTPVEITWAGAVERCLAPDQHIALLRLAQEALTNIRKHAQATRICVNLNATCPKKVELSVQDNGKGFDLDALSPASEHFGLHAMRERMTELGGDLRIETGVGSGTTVVAVLPLA